MFMSIIYRRMVETQCNVSNRAIDLTQIQHVSPREPTSIKYKVERDERYLPYIELGRWLCSHFQLETPLNFHKPIIQKLYNLEK